MECYFGYVETVLDALLVVEACRIGTLQRTHRRLTDQERIGIRSGSVFVWDEDETGIHRWTDGRSWSSSRARGSFLTYRELQDPANPMPPAVTVSGIVEEHQDSALRTGCVGVDGSQSPEARRSESPSATSSGRRLSLRQNGLIKRALSLSTTDGRKYHLISYYLANDVVASRLRLPRDDPCISAVRIPDMLYPELTCEVGSDGKKIWRFATAQGRGHASAAMHHHPPHIAAADAQRQIAPRSFYIVDEQTPRIAVARPSTQLVIQPPQAPYRLDPPQLTSVTYRYHAVQSHPSHPAPSKAALTHPVEYRRPHIDTALPAINYRAVPPPQPQLQRQRRQYAQHGRPNHNLTISTSTWHSISALPYSAITPSPQPSTPTSGTGHHHQPFPPMTNIYDSRPQQSPSYAPSAPPFAHTHTCTPPYRAADATGISLHDEHMRSLPIPAKLAYPHASLPLALPAKAPLISAYQHHQQQQKPHTVQPPVSSTMFASPPRSAGTIHSSYPPWRRNSESEPRARAAFHPYAHQDRKPRLARMSSGDDATLVNPFPSPSDWKSQPQSSSPSPDFVQLPTSQCRCSDCKPQPSFPVLPRISTHHLVEEQPVPLV